MPDYTEVRIQVDSSEQKEMLIAALAQAGFDGFEETEDILSAYIPESHFSAESLQAIMLHHHTVYLVTTIEQKNWNDVWEANFEPVQIADFCYIRANFHQPGQGFRHEIVITPKMSFGTGHHATTCLMIEELQETDCIGKSVLDFGTGTGVLAILAEKMGASRVDAIDVDDWSIANAKENIAVNHAQKINLHQNDRIQVPERFDIVLANINKNVILQSLPEIRKHIRAGGTVLLSGLLKEDESQVIEAATATGLVFMHMKERNNWISLKFFLNKIN